MGFNKRKNIIVCISLSTAELKKTNKQINTFRISDVQQWSTQSQRSDRVQSARHMMRTKFILSSFLSSFIPFSYLHAQQELSLRLLSPSCVNWRWWCGEGCVRGRGKEWLSVCLLSEQLPKKCLAQAPETGSHDNNTFPLTETLSVHKYWTNC